jgi:hypothetical protein
MTEDQALSIVAAGYKASNAGEARALSMCEWADGAYAMLTEMASQHKWPMNAVFRTAAGAIRKNVKRKLGC